MDNNSTESVAITDVSSDDLVQALCETAIALYCYDLVVKNNMASDATEQQVVELKMAFDGVRAEIIRRASKGSRKRKAVQL